MLVESPPIFGETPRPDEVPGNEAVDFEIAVSPGLGRTITSVVLSYTFLPVGTTGQVNLMDNGSGVYTGSVPSAPDGSFVVYTITATDSEGSMSMTSEETYRVLYNGITAIEEIQRTADEAPGSSPLEGIKTARIDLDAVVQDDFVADSGIRFLILQDDEDLDPWTGIWTIVGSSETVTVGDRITITEAKISEFNGLTQLDSLTFSVTGNDDPYDYKVVPTGVLNGDDAGIQEAHEGMLLRFDDVVITDVNADGTNNFGEWQFSSDGTEANEVRADDLAEAFPADYNVLTFTIGDNVEFIQGAWYYSFGNYKVVPTKEGDIGAVTVANEPVGPPQTDALRLLGASPNPFSETATIRYSLGEPGLVTLKVYDALGREVAALVDATLAPSEYAATFNARGLAAGVYVYRLAAGSEVLTGRLTVVR